MNEAFRTHPAGPTPGVIPSFPQCLPSTENCEVDLQIGIFFDGTGNNQDWDDAHGCEPGLGAGITQRLARKDSNVARLFRAYPSRNSQGEFRLYVPGVGTPCPDIGEDNYATFGPSMGRGGDGRMNYALLSVLNFIHRTVNHGNDRFAPGVILALCRNGKRGYIHRTGTYYPLEGAQDVQALSAVGMRTEGGLLSYGNGARPHAEEFYQREVQALADKIAKATKPKLVNIALDVFGFSRGATQARVFCNWLMALMDGDRLCGVPAQIRFLGLFDTVASVGIPDSAGGDGHFAWATPSALRVPSHVQCVHYIAMHENRASFPLDSLRGPDGSLPGNHKQYALPGMHSDVGGGYLPGSQGRGPSGQHDDMLSQIPLELMYEAARNAQVPLDHNNAVKVDGYDAFAVHPDARQAYAAFLQAAPAEATTAQWLIPYLAWRYQVRDVYASRLSCVARAQQTFPKDVQDLVGANQTLLDDIAALEGLTDEEIQRYRGAARFSPTLYSNLAWRKAVRRAALASEAQDVLTHLKAHPVLGTPENPEHLTPQAYLFANYMHDSYAGFRPFDQPQAWAGCIDLVPGSWETQGYLRYRRVYQGTGTPVTYAPPTEQQRQEAAQREWEAQLRTLQNSIDMGKLFNGPW